MGPSCWTAEPTEPRNAGYACSGACHRYQGYNLHACCLKKVCQPLLEQIQRFRASARVDCQDDDIGADIPTARFPAISRVVYDIVRRHLASDPNTRYARAQDRIGSIGKANALSKESVAPRALWETTSIS